MTSDNYSNLKGLLEDVIIPSAGKSLKEIGGIELLDIQGFVCNIKIALNYHDNNIDDYEKLFSDVVIENTELTQVSVAMRSHVVSHSVQSSLTPLDNVKNIIAVASGKGGVGKSTIASNIAIALQQDGASVGVLDADIYGPSQPLIFGIERERPTSNDGKNINPLVAYGVEVMSIGFLIDAKKPTVWRGPMVTSALNQLLKQTNWGDLDYLIVDMPPGTGDIQLSLSQQVPVSGAIIVTTPQDIALLDARKGLQMFRKVSVPILGIIENMSTHICSNCLHEEAIFGEGGGVKISEEFNVDLLCNIPLNSSVRKHTDEGLPSVITDPDSEFTKRFRDGSRKMAIKLATKKKDYSQHFPNIVVEET